MHRLLLPFVLFVVTAGAAVDDDGYSFDRGHDLTFELDSRIGTYPPAYTHKSTAGDAKLPPRRFM